MTPFHSWNETISLLNCKNEVRSDFWNETHCQGQKSMFSSCVTSILFAKVNENVLFMSGQYPSKQPSCVVRLILPLWRVQLWFRECFTVSTQNHQHQYQIFGLRASHWFYFMYQGTSGSSNKRFFNLSNFYTSN